MQELLKQIQHLSNRQTVSKTLWTKGCGELTDRCCKQSNFVSPYIKMPGPRPIGKSLAFPCQATNLKLDGKCCKDQHRVYLLLYFLKSILNLCRLSKNLSRVVNFLERSYVRPVCKNQNILQPLRGRPAVYLNHG